jgi:hypothetical protein
MLLLVLVCLRKIFDRVITFLKGWVPKDPSIIMHHCIL